ncbi:hypothetical protein G6F24_015625 [Rhizopus arrhizus]|nr:hypothetical protein G6F24_015625 [Rhizopus arrhizus]
MHWSILCDFDGTISLEDVIDSLLEKYGQPGWQELEEQWKSGKIGARECMQGQVRLLKLDPATLDAHLDQVQIDPGFTAFVARAEQLGLPLRIVRDGLDYACHRILANHGLSRLPVVANHLRWCEDHWELESPYQSEGTARADDRRRQFGLLRVGGCRLRVCQAPPDHPLHPCRHRTCRDRYLPRCHRAVAAPA